MYCIIYLLVIYVSVVIMVLPNACCCRRLYISSPLLIESRDQVMTVLKRKSLDCNNQTINYCELAITGFVRP